LSRLIIVSNRVAVPSKERRNQAGGLAVAMRSVLQQRSGIWFGWSGGIAPEDSELKTHAIEHGGISYVVTDLGEDDYQEYYNGFANRMLWPIMHYRLDLAEFSRRDLTGYMRVNNHFADELHKLIKPDDIIWVHDYHLIPCAKALRDRGHKNKIGFFLHIPFPPPEIMTALPSHSRLIPDMSHYDLVGFQTENDADNFGRYLHSECGMTRVSRFAYKTPHGMVNVGVFPIGIETANFSAAAQRAARSGFVSRFVESLAGRAMIIGVDRLDYSKGLALRMEAFESFLTHYPQWQGEVTYLQITPKSRSEIQEYGDMERKISEAAGRINGAFGEVSWTPIRYVNRAHARSELAGLYRAAKAALVTPLRDGMNLVAKEYLAAQNPLDPGVLILSRFAGAANELKAALLVNPYDIEAVGAAIDRALSMSLEERRSRHQQMYEILCANDIAHWGERFLSSLAGQTAVPTKPARSAH
jgi:trehalose 6-phosphate synthase